MKFDSVLQKKSDKGLIRENNEDRVEILSHPENSDIKLLAIADGMGGRSYGEVASNFVIERLCHWFYNLGVDKLNQTIEVSELLKSTIVNINEDLISIYGENCLGTTLTLALINKYKTIVLNIGDSRCYIYKSDSKNLLQVSEDDSNVWLYYKYGQVDKEELRYFSTSNLINACIGLNRELCTSNVVFFDNDSYDLLLLVTDGVTDLLTDQKIKYLIENNSEDEILDKIIKEAVYVDQKLHVPLKLRAKYSEPFYVPSCGKDNASGAIFIKSKI